MTKRLTCLAFYALAGLAVVLPASGQTKAAPARARGRTQIVFLGTGYPRPMPERMGPSIAIVVNGTPYIVDAGVGVVRRATEASKTVKALDAPNLRFVFITHLHSDHTIGLPDLMTTPWIMGRDKPMELYGPPGISNMAKHLREAYKEDANIRIRGLEHANENGSAINAYDVKPGFVYRDSNVKVTVFPVKHGSWKNAYGYRFETPDRTIVISGDASPSETVVEQCNGCDVLIHEAYTQLGYSKSTEEWKQYIQAFHTSSKELADIATRAKPKTLILFHQMYFGGAADTEAVLLKEVRAGYKGRVVAAHDLDVF